MAAARCGFLSVTAIVMMPLLILRDRRIVLQLPLGILRPAHSVSFGQLEAVDQALFHGPAAQNPDEQGPGTLLPQQVAGRASQRVACGARQPGQQAHRGSGLIVGRHQLRRGLVALGQSKRQETAQKRSQQNRAGEPTPFLPQQAQPLEEPFAGQGCRRIAGQGPYVPRFAGYLRLRFCQPWGDHSFHHRGW
jgi:hypothetical protein